MGKQNEQQVFWRETDSVLDPLSFTCQGVHMCDQQAEGMVLQIRAGVQIESC